MLFDEYDLPKELFRFIKDKGSRMTFSEVLELLPEEPVTCGERNRFWTDGNEILCRTESDAEHLADRIDESMNGCVPVTGYYDPLEDERNGEADIYTGFYSVAVD